MSGGISFLESMMFIRAFETALAARPDHGFQLLSTGAEAVAVGLASALGPDDQLLTGGRSIGPALARGVEPNRLMAELLGRVSGPNRGKGGRGHLSDPAAGFFGAHAVVGGNLSIAAGVALARLTTGDSGLVAVLFGDGACGAGALHETLNIASLWKLPLLFVCDNNQISVSTRRRDALAAPDLAELARAHGMPGHTVDGLDVEATAQAAGAAAAAIRGGGGPMFLEMLSLRLARHSTSARETRSAEELARLRALCPISRYIGVLRSRGALDSGTVALLERRCAERAAEALAFADASPPPDPAQALTDVW
jgi:pyruvate dehydrogenase E1 component alpha subunit